MAGTLAMPTLLQRVVIDTRGLTQGAAEVEHRLARSGASATALERRLQSTGKTGRLATLALAGGALAVGAALERAVSHAAEYAAGVRRIQQFTGGTAEESSRLAFVLGRIGIDTNTGARAIGLFSKNLENGSKNLTKYFTAAQLARFQSQGLIKTIPELAQKYQSLATATERNAFLLNVFGRGGTQIRRLLELTGADFRSITAEAAKFGLVLTQENIAAFRKFSESEREVGQALKGLEVQVGNAVIPAFEAAAHAVTLAATEFERLPQPVKSALVDALLFASGLTLVVKGFQFLGSGISTVVGLLPSFTLGMTGAALAEGEVALGLAAMNPGWGAAIAGMAGVAEEAPLAAAGLSTLAAATGIGALLAILGLLVKHTIDFKHGMDEDFKSLDKFNTAVSRSGRAAGLHGRSLENLELDAAVAGAGGVPGVKTETARKRIVANIDLLVLAIHNGKTAAERDDISDAIARNHIAAAERLAGLTTAQQRATREADKEAAAQRAFMDSIGSGVQQAEAAKSATDVLTATVDKFGISSGATAIAIANYVDAVTQSTASDKDALEPTNDLYKQREAATAQGVQLAEQESQAAKKRAEDEQTASDAVIRASQAVQDSKQRLADTQVDAARSIRDADQAVKDAELSLVEAQNRERDAQLALTDARKQASLALEDLTFRVEENAISQQRNSLRVVDARKALADARKEGDPEKVKNAELDLKEALLQQREQITQAKRDQDDLNKRRKQGVAGSPEVVAAEKALADASKGVTDAQRSASRSIEDAARARHRASEDIQAATRGVADAQRDLARANRELADSIRQIAAAMAIINAQNAQVASAVGAAFSGVGFFHEGGMVMHKGGEIPRMHSGGLRSDERHVIAQAGEFMFRRQAVRSIGADNLAAMNRSGRVPGPSAGEIADAMVAAMQRAGFGQAAPPVIYQGEDPSVLARELAYQFGRGR